jgi:FkbH-like protein
MFADLAWLPEAPADFRAMNRALAEETAAGSRGPEVIRLATHALSDTQLERLAGSIRTLVARGANLAPLTTVRLGVVGTGTLDLVLPALVASAARHGILLECVTGSYGQFVQEALQPDSAINAARCDAVLLALDHRSLPISSGLAGRDSSVAACLSFIEMLRRGFRDNSGASCIVQTLAPPPEALFGSLDRRVATSTRAIVEAVNQGLVRQLEGSSDLIFDVAALAETVGLAEWYSPEQWNLAKLPFSSTYARLYADALGRLLGAMRGKARRCLILDLDNTVWGGVIGDDGMDGIKIAQGDATGEAFLEVQRTALLLRERGVVLAVSSKNTDEIARAVFREHPEMLLREQHIAVFQANWNDKATNIRAIAEELSLGLSAMVFLDDNPVERAQVRAELPAVLVPELPTDPAGYRGCLLELGVFDSLALTAEDRRRNQLYADQKARRQAEAGMVNGGSVDDYLADLGLIVEIDAADDLSLPRIAQLTNKTNQFNLTTRRYTEAELSERIARGWRVFGARVRDRFGDNGLTAAIAVEPSSSNIWTVDTFLLSCRVMGRRVETALLALVGEEALRCGARRLQGWFLPTEKNAPAVNVYREHGFSILEQRADGSVLWELDLTTGLPTVPAWLTVRTPAAV